MVEPYQENKAHLEHLASMDHQVSRVKREKMDHKDLKVKLVPLDHLAAQEHREQMELTEPLVLLDLLEDLVNKVRKVIVDETEHPELTALMV